MSKHYTLYITVFVLLILQAPAAAQTKIHLIISSAKPVELVDASDFSFTKISESAFKDTVVFNYNNTLPDAYIFGWTISGKRYHTSFPVWLDTGNVFLHAHTDSNKLVIDTVIHAPFYYYERNYFKNGGDIFKTKDTARYSDYVLKNIEANLDNPFSLYIASNYLNVIQNDKQKVTALQQLFSKQGNRFSWHRSYPELTDRLTSILSLDHLNLASYTLINRQYKTVLPVFSGADFYVLDFWFLGCAPCRADHKLIKAKLQELKNHKIEVIGISTDPFEIYSKEWKKYLSINKYSWPNYIQPKVNKISNSLGINAFPNYVVINNKGEITGRCQTFSEILKSFNINR
jgi:thiol-disulfide isomerase/thioredoxin